MGSWSVYCGISNIAITAGQNCVFLPLKKNTSGRGYMPFMPATLPIFGEYDDYGGIENIIRDKNVELIEEHFKCTIEEFCYYHTRGPIRDDEDDFPKKLKKIKEIKNWTYMWIDRKVYDFLVANRNNSFGGVGHHDYGDPNILKHLGFSFIGESENNPTYDPKRYKQIWTFGGKTFYSDGTWLHAEKDGIYNIKGGYNSLHKHVKVTDEQVELQNKYSWELWELYDEDKAAELLFFSVGIDPSSYSHNKFMKRYKAMATAANLNLKDLDIKDTETTIADKYTADYKSYGDLMCQIMSIRFNLHCMSHYFAPFVQYLTPQCGERRAHQVILDTFASINKEYMKDYDDDYDYDEDYDSEELTDDESN